MSMKEFILYKIYYGKHLKTDYPVYIGRTEKPLINSLRELLLTVSEKKKPDVQQISKVETARLATEAYMLVMETVLINQYKPMLNTTQKAMDQLTLTIPEPPFSPLDDTVMETLKREFLQRKTAFENVRNQKSELLNEHRKKRQEIFSNKACGIQANMLFWTTLYIHPTGSGLSKSFCRFSAA